MTKEEQAQKEIEAFGWMKSKGYDRRACKDIAPILVKYHAEQCNIADVGKRIFIVFAQRQDPLNEAREIVKVFTSEVAAVTWIADNNPKKYYYEIHKVG